MFVEWGALTSDDVFLSQAFYFFGARSPACRATLPYARTELVQGLGAKPGHRKKEIRRGLLFAFR